MSPNQVVCRDCDYFMVGPNQAQVGPTCMHAPPIANLVGTGTLQQVLSIRPAILDPDKEYCSFGYKFRPMLPASVPNTDTGKVPPSSVIGLSPTEFFQKLKREKDQVQDEGGPTDDTGTGNAQSTNN